MTRRLPQWQQKWTRDSGYVYSVSDPLGRLWVMYRSSVTHDWALSCREDAALAVGIAHVGGGREFDFAEKYILAKS